MSKGLEVVLDSKAVRIIASGPILVAQFRTNVSADTLRVLERTQETMLKSIEGGTLLLTIIDASVPLPTEDARSLVIDTFRRMSARNAAAATVVRGEGFWVSAIRSTLTALNLVVRPGCPQRTFAEVDEAMDWLRTHDASQSIDARAIAVSIERVATIG